MKNVLIAAALITAAVSTPALSQTADVNWEGNSGTLAPRCVFGAIKQGTVGPDGDGWKVTDAALVEMKSYGISEINVTNDGLLRTQGGASAKVVVDYGTSYITKDTADGERTIALDGSSFGLINMVNPPATGLAKNLVVITGSLSSDGDGLDVILPNTDYYLVHTVTCVQ